MFQKNRVLNNKYLFIVIFLLIITTILFLRTKRVQDNNLLENINNQDINSSEIINENDKTVDSINKDTENRGLTKNKEQENSTLYSPLEESDQREIKKPFGIYITPEESPVQPERFKGYHTGIDFEVFEKELNNEVFVYAICQGKIELKNYINGYGGVLVESCLINEEPVTIVYGHLDLSSIDKAIGDRLMKGEKIGLLGKHKSQETDYERKHLHLGIHKGGNINILGYVNSKDQLSNWINPCVYLCD